MQRFLSTATIVGLLIATAAAFAITERLKLTKSPITGTLVSKTFSPSCGCADVRASISVKLRRSDAVTVTIDDGGRRPVRTLVAGEPVPRGRNVFHWDGKTDLGTRAPDGVYRVEIHLDAQHRTILLPNEIRLDTTPPEVVAAYSPHPQFSPDGDHRADSVSIRYGLSKEAHVRVYLGDRLLIRGRSHKAEGAVAWSGTVDGRLLPPGTYTLTVGAVDLAGNSTPLARRGHVQVELRYITLANHRLTGVVAGTPFDIGVSTDAKRYRWTLGARKGMASGPDLKLLAPRTPGTYRLTVTEHGHSDRAVVVVR